MIPSDAASALRQILPEQHSASNQQTQPVEAIRNVVDVLRDLVPGQRILAEIKALLPNGAYRAVVAQRDITLALPFSAKPGDSLELEVTENDGKLALAFVTNRGQGNASANSTPPPSVATSLTATAKMIGNLLGDINPEQGRAPAAPLNSNQPIVQSMPDQTAALVSRLKEALSNSGVFYESHQARWVTGHTTLESLRNEPQGQLPSSPTPATVDPKNAQNIENTSGAATLTKGLPSNAMQTGIEAPGDRSELMKLPTGQPLPQDIVRIVQQQLDGLSNQNFLWQGQIWPGQDIQWEISDQGSEKSIADPESMRWKTSLHLDLPTLGGVSAAIKLGQNNTVQVELTTNQQGSESQLQAHLGQLADNLTAAGLTPRLITAQWNEHQG